MNINALKDAVLLQCYDKDGDQARVVMTPHEAKDVAERLLKAAEVAKTNKAPHQDEFPKSFISHPSKTAERLQSKMDDKWLTLGDESS